MASPCMTAVSATGLPPRWVRTATSSATWQRQFAPKACTLATSSHRVEHNFFLGVGPHDSIRTSTIRSTRPSTARRTTGWKTSAGTPLANDFTYVSPAWADDWLARSSEIVEKYHPDIMYFDWWIGQPSIRPNLTRFAAFYYNASLKYGDHVGVINYKD